MKLNRRTVVLAAVIIIILVGIIALFTANSGIQQPKAPTPSPVAVETPPQTIHFPQISQGAQFTYTGQDKNTPASLPIYRYSQNLSPQSLTAIGDDISTKFGLVSSASAIINGTSFAYTRNDKNRWFSLALTKDIVSITYERLLVEDKTLFLLNDDRVITAYFSPLLSLSPEEQLYSLQGGVASLEGVIVLERPLPKLSNHDFGLSLNNIPLLTTDYSQRWANMITDDTGAIRLLNYLIPPAITSVGEVQIISRSDALANINSGKGVLTWISQATGSQYSVTPSFKRGVLDNFSLVYIKQNGSLVPAYLFNGNGISSDGNQQIFEVLVLASQGLSR